MSVIEGTAVNIVVRLHYLDAHADGRDELPIVIVPGLSERAEEYIGLMTRLSPRRCVAISPRGRGRSDAPARGYGLDDHAGDVLAVVRQATLARCVLVGRGGLLAGKDVKRYRRAGIANLRVAWLDTGHDLLAPDEGAFVDVLEGFLRDIPLAGSRPG